MNKYPYLAREGWLAIFNTVMISVFAFLAFPALIVVILPVAYIIINFYRDPQRTKPKGKNLVLSPADGTVIKIENTKNPQTDKDSIKISIFMNPFNVHSNKTPVAGTVTKIEYTKGAFLNAALDKASKANERNAVTIKTKQGYEITFIQIAGFLARRIKCYLQEGQEVDQGYRYGFIKLGSRVDLYLPLEARVSTSIGQKVYGVETILAYLPEQEM